MEGVAAKVQEEITSLQGERAALLAKLEKIELALTKAQAAKVFHPRARPVQLSSFTRPSSPCFAMM